jgi:Skp family chaperone for outer membrane proteins
MESRGRDAARFVRRGNLPMKQVSPWSRSLTVLSLCAACVMGGVAWKSASARVSESEMVMAPVKPTAVAVVDLKKLIDAVKEFKDGMEFLDTQKKDALSKIDELKEKLKKLNDDITKMKDVATLERLKKQQEALELEALLNARAQTSQRILQVQAGDLLRQVFDKTVEAGKKISKEDGWDIILIDDRNVKPPERMPGEDGKDSGPRLTIDQVQSIIQQRHILSAVDRVDITDRFITMMNGDYKGPKH